MPKDNKLARENLVQLLRWAADNIEKHDSLEGRLEYHQVDVDTFVVNAFLRYDNLNGQGRAVHVDGSGIDLETYWWNK